MTEEKDPEAVDAAVQRVCWNVLRAARGGTLDELGAALRTELTAALASQSESHAAELARLKEEHAVALMRAYDRGFTAGKRSVLSFDEENDVH
jgi:hypothetical protein